MGEVRTVDGSNAVALGDGQPSGLHGFQLAVRGSETHCRARARALTLPLASFAQSRRSSCPARGAGRRQSGEHDGSLIRLFDRTSSCPREAGHAFGRGHLSRVPTSKEPLRLSELFKEFSS